MSRSSGHGRNRANSRSITPSHMIRTNPQQTGGRVAHPTTTTSTQHNTHQSRPSFTQFSTVYADEDPLYSFAINYEAPPGSLRNPLPPSTTTPQFFPPPPINAQRLENVDRPSSSQVSREVEDVASATPRESTARGFSNWAERNWPLQGRTNSNPKGKDAERLTPQAHVGPRSADPSANRRLSQRTWDGRTTRNELFRSTSGAHTRVREVEQSSSESGVSAVTAHEYQQYPIRTRSGSVLPLSDPNLQNRRLTSLGTGYPTLRWPPPPDRSRKKSTENYRRAEATADRSPIVPTGVPAHRDGWRAPTPPRSSQSRTRPRQSSSSNSNSRRTSTKEDQQRRTSFEARGATAAALDRAASTNTRTNTTYRYSNTTTPRTTNNTPYIIAPIPETFHVSSPPLNNRTSLSARSYDTGLLPLCIFCSNNPATVTKDAGLFCAGCWDTAMQAETDRHVLHRPGDLGEFPSSAQEFAVQEEIRRARRVSFLDPGPRQRTVPEPNDVPAEYQLCKCESRPATVVVDEVGALCQQCWGQVTDPDRVARDSRPSRASTLSDTDRGTRDPLPQYQLVPTTAPRRRGHRAAHEED